MQFLFPKIQHPYLLKKFQLTKSSLLNNTFLNLVKLLCLVRSIGTYQDMSMYEKRKLGVFNQLNFFQIITGTSLPFIGIFQFQTSSIIDILVICLLPFVSIMVLMLNAYYKHETARLTYFICYPLFTSLVYLNGINTGIELNFIMYGVFAVFFLRHTGQVLMLAGFSMINYYVLSVVVEQYRFQMADISPLCYHLNHLSGIVYIFSGLYLIKEKYVEYQFSILNQNRQLQKKNLEIQKHQVDILEKSKLLKKQSLKLEETNRLKDRLFSVIGHDLKMPVYALRNLFRNAQELNMPGEQIKQMLPDINADLNYTTALLENLLYWAKSQMESACAIPQKIDIGKLVEEAIKLMRLQAESKKIAINFLQKERIFINADVDMVRLIIRNLLSNAIKFTPEKGRIYIDITLSDSVVQTNIKDSGKGITNEQMKKINENNFYSTIGTSSESGSGIGLMLCKEFLEKNQGYLMIESEPGQGSTFSFSLPIAV